MKKTQGFTLVEIMIVVAIIGILAAIAIPNFVRNRNQSQRNACIGNLKQISTAVEEILIEGGTPADSNDETDANSIASYVKNYGSLACPKNKGFTYCGAQTGAAGAGSNNDWKPTCGGGDTTHAL